MSPGSTIWRRWATRAARERAQDWVFGWIGRYGRGSGPGWTPDLTGRRLIRWINHAILLLNGRDRAECGRLFPQPRRTRPSFWRGAGATASPGAAAVRGADRADLCGPRADRDGAACRPRAAAALARECEREIDADGGIPTRNPEDLLEVFTLLTWATAALGEAGRSPHPSHLAAIARIAPTLRALRHADGGLARFHGGGRGA